MNPESFEKRVDCALLVTGVMSEIKIDFRPHFGVFLECL